MARIYVIDDDEQLLRMVGLMLERGGHSVTLINNPVKGLEEIRANKPDLLVLDVMMPDMSGHDIARQIRATPGLENLPILVLTARSQQIDKETALASGANDYLSKPVTSQELIERVDNLLSQKSILVPGASKGLIVAFYGLRGGVGRTTLAVNLAGALRRLSQEEICLVDLSPSCGQAAMHLRLQTRSSWAELPTASEVEWPILKNRLLIHPSGLRLLASPLDPKAPSMPSAELTQRVLNLLRDRMAVTIVDLPPVYSPAFEAAMEAADVGLHVIGPDVISVQTAVQLNRKLVKLGITFRQKSYILNQTSAEAQLPPATVERGLNARVAFQISYDTHQARALAQGVPLTLTSAKSPLPILMHRMADVLWHRVAQKSG
ncbi:MAG: response regulator [Chloroflexi bacterium]|nr:MAG: response regulator [Chloroflexota bacterium]